MKDIFYQFRDAKKTAHVLIPWMVAKDLKPGTPISDAGEVKNNSYAWGLLTHNGDVGDIVVKDGVSYVNAEVIRGGYVDLNAVKELSGYTLTTACKNALSGIIFVVNGKLAGGLPDATAADEGKALLVGDDGEPEWGDIGSPLPTPTTEGAVLEVGSVADPSVVILPEQTVEFDEEMDAYIPVGGTPSVLEEGLIVCVTVNGTSQIVSVTTASGGTAWAFGATGLYYVLEVEPNFWIFNGDYDGEPVTISVTGTKPEWGEDPFGDYDVVVRSSDSALNRISADELTLVKGGYLAALERAKKGLPIRCYAYYAGHSIDAETGDDIYVVYDFTVSHQIFSNDRYDGELSFYIAGNAINPTNYGLVYITPSNTIGYQYKDGVV